MSFVKKLIITVGVIFIVFLVNLFCWNYKYDRQIEDIKATYNNQVREYEELRQELISQNLL